MKKIDLEDRTSWTDSALAGMLPPLMKSRQLRPPSADQGQTRTGSGLSVVTRRRRWAYCILALIGVPALVLLATEGLLRLAGFGYATDFFRVAHRGTEAVLQDNSHFGRRFFPPSLVRCAQPFTIPLAKSPGTIRIFVLGESAAMGDPDFKFGLPRMLEVLLRQRFPQVQFEVINASVVAINSHVILPIGRDCATRESDLWLVYMGNNEAIGPFGSASVFGAKAPPLGLVRAGLWLKELRLGQALDAVLGFAQHGRGRAPEWQGMKMMAEQRVAHNSATAERVYDHFQRNLTDLLRVATGAGIPVVLCTVGTNLKDCAPFASLHRRGLTAAELTRWQGAYGAGTERQAQGNFKEALAFYAEAQGIDSQFADLAFRRGQCLERLGSPAEAVKCYHEAREWDALQFRADDRINNTIRSEADAFSNHGVRLVDADKLFAAASPEGLVGSEYFYEHVHLTPEGNYLLARAAAQQVAEALRLKAPGEWASLSECLHLLGFTDWNRYDALEVILDRIQAVPFSTQLNHEMQIERLKEQLERYRMFTKPAQLRRAASQVAPLVARYPQNADLRWNLASLLTKSGDAAGAEEQWKALVSLQPQSALPLFNLAGLLEAHDRLIEALQDYRQCLEVSPDYYPARFALGMLSLKTGHTQDATEQLRLAVRQKPNSAEARLAFAQALTSSGKTAEATKQFQEILKFDPKNQLAQQHLKGSTLDPASPAPAAP